MARYAVGFQKQTTAAAGIICDLRTAAGVDARVWEIWVTAETAVAGTVGLVRSTGAGTTPGGGVTPQAEDTKNPGAASTTVYTSYATEPTQAAVYLRRVALPATVGAGITWTFPDGLTLPTGTTSATGNGLLLRQLSTAQVTYSVTIVYDE